VSTIQQYPDLQNKAVLITGVSRPAGIGAALARAFAAQGCRLFLTGYLRADQETYPESVAGEKPELLVRELSPLCDVIHYLDSDLARADAPETVFETATDLLGPMTVLINNAAHSVQEGWEQLTMASLDYHYAINVRAPVRLATLFARQFVSGAGGRIINLTSGQDVGPMPDTLAYATTKGALASFTRSLAKGVAKLGITVNAIDPGPTDTGWMSAELKATLAVSSEFGRVGRPEEAARLALFLASEGAAWITGQVIHARGDF
jgi:3-oxoacyl-[acyl-carrier protein] reductase